MKSFNYKKYLKGDNLYVDRDNNLIGSNFCMFEFINGIPGELLELTLQDKPIKQAIDLDFKSVTLDYKYSLKHHGHKYKHFYKVDCKEYAKDVYVSYADKYSDLVDNAQITAFVGQLRPLKCFYNDFVVYVMPLRIEVDILT